MDEKNFLILAAGLLVIGLILGVFQFASSLIGSTSKGGADVIYNIAIYKDAVEALGIASSPDYLGSLLDSRGYNVQYLDSKDLARTKAFNAKNFDLVVLPYGGTFPEDAVANMTTFLMDGGSFFSTGGYTFDSLEHNLLNTRYGHTVGDGMSVYDEQVGVFDPDFSLERVTYALANSDQSVISKDTTVGCSLSGYAASGFFGNGNAVFADAHARRIPLMYGYDKYGRNRGSIGAIIYNYKGTFESSAWGFFGVTNEDLFTKNHAGMGEAFVDTVVHMLTKTFICSVTTNYACYRQGEGVLISADVANYGKQDRELSVKVLVGSGEDRLDQVVFTRELDMTLKAKENRTINIEWEPGSFRSDFYTVVVEVYLDNHLWDTENTGFVVWDENIIRCGPKITYKDNYFTIDGRNTLIFAVKSAGFQFASPLESPLNWARELKHMRDNGINAFEIIHLSGFMDDLTSPDETVMRKLDALVQLSQKYGVVYKIGVFDWVSIVQTDKQMQERLQWVEFLAKRYEGVSGIMFDLMGDIPLIDLNDMSQPQLMRAFTEFVEEKYPSIAERQEIWGRTSGPYPMESSGLTFEIADTRMADLLSFRNNLFSEWTYGPANILRKYFDNNTIHAEYYGDRFWIP
jgi:hypothetical protein